MLLGKLRTLSYVAFRVGERFDSFESFETIFLVSDFSQNPKKQDGQRKDKTSRPFSRRPPSAEGPKGCGTNHFFGSKCGRRGLDGCTGIRASFRFSVVHSPHRRPRRFCFFPHVPHFSKGHNRSVAHVCQAAAGRAVSRHGVRSSHKRCSHRALQIIKQPQGVHRIKQHHHVLHSCFQPRHWLRCALRHRSWCLPHRCRRFEGGHRPLQGRP